MLDFRRALDARNRLLREGGSNDLIEVYELTLAQVHSALAYYFDHKEEIDQSIAKDDAFVEEMRNKTPSLLAQRLYERSS